MTGRPILERVLVAVLSLAATFLYFIDYLPPFKRVHLWSDIAGYSYPLHQYAFASLKQGRIPEWDPSIYCGISFAGNPQAALFYPGTWLLYAAVWRLPQLPFQVLEVFAFAHVWISFLLAYGWLRGRAGPFASVLGAATFAFAGQMVYQLLHLGNTCATAWLPLALWGIDESVRCRGWRPLWKVVLASALCFLAGYPACWIAFCGIAFVYALAGEGRWRMALGVAAALAASVLLFLVQLLPAMEAASLVRVDPRYFPSQYGWSALLLAHFIPNWFDFNPGHPTYFDPGCLYFYLGLPAIFALGWMAYRRQMRPYWQVLFTLAAALFFANPVLPLVRLVERIPVLAGTMQPYEFYAGVSAMAALVAAMGVEDFLSSKPPRPLAGLTALLVCLTVLPIAVRELRTWAAGGHFAIGWSAAAELAIALLAFSAAMFAFRAATGRLRMAMAGVLLFFVAVDLKVFGAGRWFNAVDGDEDRNHATYGIAAVDDDAFRTMLAHRQYRVATAEDAGPASTDYRAWGLATPAGFDPLIPIQYHDAVERWTPFRTNREFWIDLANPQMLQTLGVRFVLARRGSSPERLLATSPDFRLLGRPDVFCPVYEYLRARQPFFLESSAAVTASGWTPERRDFDLPPAATGRLVVIEQFYPGWHASADGREVPIERWGGAFQAIALPPGAHHVTLRFRPTSWRVGAWISLLSATVLCVLVLSRRTKYSK